MTGTSFSQDQAALSMPSGRIIHDHQGCFILHGQTPTTGQAPGFVYRSVRRAL